MPLDLSFRGRSVLLTGAGPATAPTAQALLRDGAVVTVAADPATVPTSVRDLADRGLLTLCLAADPLEHDVVIRATAAPAPLDRPDHNGRTGRNSHDSCAGHGSVTLLGGGPGDPGLLTVAGLAAIRDADIIVHDRLAPLEALHHARPEADVVDVGKIPRGELTPQERINELLLEHARAGRKVLRLKGGDCFVFGRGGEEAEACAAAGIPVSVIPGVSSSIAAPALAGIPITHRGLVQGFTVVSGHVPPGDSRSTVDWAALARSGTTLVVLMGVATLPAICNELVGLGLDPDTPAAVVADAGLPSMRVVRATVATIAELAVREGLGAPAVTVIGAVAALDLRP